MGSIFFRKVYQIWTKTLKNESFYNLIRNVLYIIHRDVGKIKIRKHDWGKFDKCCSHEFQLTATETVAADRNQTHFKVNSESSMKY